MRKLSTVLALLAMTALPGHAHAAPAVGRYVALGDSYAAVGDLLDQYGTPGCFRSRKNVANFLAAELHPAEFVDMSCGDATTANMTVPQAVGLGVNPAQFDALIPDTDLVTLSIGGNDLNLPATLGPCGVLAVTDPDGNPCQRFYTADGVDRLADRLENEIRPRIAAVLRELRDRAPHARIVVIDYASPLPEWGNCYPAAPFARGDVPYLRATVGRLAAIQLEEARRVGAIGVDVFGVPGHDMCQPVGARWIEPLVPAAATTPFHPNSTATAAIARMVAAALDSN
ncbi:SGNH/GDSL hydrolase family protein [Nocardia sp. CDC153]|uniref:SGNH/GDSL hydrolase family protein n=1 Tax=Nocardia sp. CDC153 TaxID=3112167 RepID=UPI002DB731AC|nr:SGNH/GDSL hydrolase family protein [Nocardia sp. CDC153]MEC3951808.1 SGNH/GDSL hydrolase family protein [Nocardia sp. CDC153]